MPISTRCLENRLSQKEFGEIAYELMSHVFSIHNEFGRFCLEDVFKRELASRFPCAELESPVTLTHASFSKTYFIDALVGRQGVFEFKSVDSIHDRHRGQLINYLLLTNQEHGKIVNVRSASVEHEFVNCPYQLCNSRSPEVVIEGWDGCLPGAQRFQEMLLEIVCDWGVGLELACYAEAMGHFLHGESNVAVYGSSGQVGSQKFQLSTDGVAFKLTALDRNLDLFEKHTLRLLSHTKLHAIVWANMIPGRIRFRVLKNH